MPLENKPSLDEQANIDTKVRLNKQPKADAQARLNAKSGAEDAKANVYNKPNNIFSNLETALISHMKITMNHSLEDGKYREQLTRDILGKVIPAKYEITNGFVIDSEHNRSEEMDVIIYDKSDVPPFFEKTYTVVPIEAVIAVIQAKTTLTSVSLSKAVKNLNSIDHLVAKIGGKILSAGNGAVLEERRFIAPYKIVVAYKSDFSLNNHHKKEMTELDMIYVIDETGHLFMRHRPAEGVVNLDKAQLNAARNKGETEFFTEDKLFLFVFYLLEKMKLINNALIINYEEYIKGEKKAINE